MYIPRSTYRLQFEPDFTFTDAKKCLPYLAELGISDVYASPILQPRKGSDHGYDVIDPREINPELGGMNGFLDVSDTAKELGMGWLQDIVPNHMAYSTGNPMLMDVLENGPDSRYYDYFDITWQNQHQALDDTVLAPFLGSFFGDALEKGEIQLRYGRDGFAVAYYDFALPVNVETYTSILSSGLPALRRDMSADHPDLVKFLGILYILRFLPGREDIGERYNQIHFIKRILWELYSSNNAIRGFIDDAVVRMNGTPDDTESFNDLEQLLGEQYYRLSFWKVATEEINYRRFFTINDLITLRVEHEEVFNAVHGLVFDLYRQGRYTGLRIDHVDGLYDPAAYLRRLRREAPDAYIVVEKILESTEKLPGEWPIQGTTGYDFTNKLNGLFCRRKNMDRLVNNYRKFTGMAEPYERMVSARKRLIIGKHLAGDIDNLAHLLKSISGRYRYGSDLTLYGLRRALVEVMAQFPVYRTYVDPSGASEQDRTHIDTAIRKAIRSNPEMLHELNVIRRFLLQEHDRAVTEDEAAEWLHFAHKFQQMTGPLMAKGFEDTMLYVYVPLLSVNEVGGDPSSLGMSTGDFHAYLTDRMQQWPSAMNATATHDTKRGEDVRARLNVLSEIPAEWNRRVRSWSRLNRKVFLSRDDAAVPDLNDEYFLYQTLLGTWPLDKGGMNGYADRVTAYLVKAVREAKQHTAWLTPDTDYEEAFTTFARRCIDSDEGKAFLREFLPFQKKVAWYGMLNSLSQALLKATAPGVPDFYRGTEFWDLHLVDPDNRRPVDFPARRRALASIRRDFEVGPLNLIASLLGTMENGWVKLFLTWRALTTRNHLPDLFARGRYVPLTPTGRKRNHLIAFARELNGTWTVTAVPCFMTTLAGEGGFPLGGDAWESTRLPLPDGFPPQAENTLTGETVSCGRAIPVAELFAHFPGALLTAG